MEQKTGLSRDVISSKESMKEELRSQMKDVEEKSWKSIEEHTGLSKDALLDKNAIKNLVTERANIEKNKIADKVNEAKNEFSKGRKEVLAKYNDEKSKILKTFDDAKSNLIKEKDALVNKYNEKMENLVATHIWEQLEEQTGISSDKLKNKEYLKALAYKKVNDATKDAESLVDELKKNTAVNPLEDAEKLALLLHENKVLQKALGVVNKENSQTQTSLFIEIKSQTQMPAFVKEINALRTDIETSFLEVVDGKNLNEYNAPGYEAAVKSVNKKYMHAILNHYDVNLSDERLSKVHRAASLLEKEHRLLQHGKIKKISDDIETKFDNAFLETGMSTKHTESRALFSKRGGEQLINELSIFTGN